MTVPAACARCGNGIPAGAAACPTCGLPVGQPSGHTTERVWLPGQAPASQQPASPQAPAPQPPAPAQQWPGQQPAQAPAPQQQWQGEQQPQQPWQGQPPTGPAQPWQGQPPTGPAQPWQGQPPTDAPQDWQGVGEATVLGAPRVPAFAPPKGPLVDGSAPTAGMGARFGAAVIDGLILAIPGVVALVATGGAVFHLTVNDQPLVDGGRVPANPSPVPTLLAGLVSLLIFAGMLAWEGTSGKTPGKATLGLRTVAVATGGPLGVPRAMLRGLIVLAGYVACAIGALLVVLSPLFDSGPLRQGWQDKVGRARVVSVRAGGAAGPSQGPYATSGLPAPVAERGASDLFPAPAPQHAPPAAPSTAVGSAPPWGGPVPPPAPAWGGAPAPDPARAAQVGQVAPAWTPPAAPTGLVTGVPQAAGAPAPPAQAPVQPSAPQHQPPMPGAPAQPDPRGPHGTAPRFELDLGDGQRVPLTGPTLLGRDPAPQPGAPTGPAGPRLVTVPDPQRSISKTHAEMGVDQHGAWLIDRGSTNGTFVTPARGTEQRVASGQHVRVPVGATVRLGERRLLVLDGGLAEETVISVRDLPPQGGGSW